ncbi:hypothetical protein ACFQU2_16670 [Siccirubricoccus deserti]
MAALAYALRYDARGKPRKCGWDHAADLAAEWLAEHLRRLDLIASGAAPPRCTGPGENGLSGCQHGGMVAVMAVSLSPNSAPARTSLLDGASHPEKLVRTAAALGLGGLGSATLIRRGQARELAPRGPRPVRSGVSSNSVLAGASEDLLFQVSRHQKVMMARFRISSSQKETILGSRDLTLDCISDHQFSWHPKPG